MPRATTAKKPTPAAKEETSAIDAQVAPETTVLPGTEASKAPVVEVEEVKSASEKLTDVKVIKDFKAFYGTQHHVYKKSEKTVKLPSTLATMLEKSGKVIIR